MSGTLQPTTAKKLRAIQLCGLQEVYRCKEHVLHTSGYEESLYYNVRLTGAE